MSIRYVRTIKYLSQDVCAEKNVAPLGASSLGEGGRGGKQVASHTWTVLVTITALGLWGTGSGRR